MSYQFPYPYLSAKQSNIMSVSLEKNLDFWVA